MLDFDISQEEVTFLGIKFKKMTDHDREPFLGSGPEAYIHYGNGLVIIFEPLGVLEPDNDDDKKPRIIEMWEVEAERPRYREWVMSDEGTN